MKITIDDGDDIRVIDVDQANAMPGIGIEIVQDGIARMYPWHRIMLIEREVVAASNIVVPPSMGFET